MLYDNPDNPGKTLLRIHEKAERDHARGIPIDAFAHFALSESLLSDASFSLSKSDLALAVKRLHLSDLFHSVTYTKWDYVGRFPLVLPEMGLPTYGDV